MISPHIMLRLEASIQMNRMSKTLMMRMKTMMMKKRKMTKWSKRKKVNSMIS
jgi:hypothetical protein